jgi:ankyrin repeat protein
VYVGAVAFVQLLLGHGANPMVKDSDGRLPIHWSVYVKSPKCLLCLLSVTGCDVNVMDNAGMTPLMWAAYHDTPMNISELLSHGADADEKDIDGKTAMHWAVHKSNARSLKLLLKHDRTFYKDKKGRTVLHIAADMGSIPCCQLILKIRPDSVHDSDKDGRTPLHWAAVRSRVDVCALLLNHGADASERDHHDKTALDYAREKNLTYVEALLTCHDAAIADYARSGSYVNLESVLTERQSSSSSSGVDELGYSSPKRIGSPHNAVAPLREHLPIAWGFDRTVEQANILEKGCWLSKWTVDSKDEVGDYFFWLDIEMGHVCWAKRPSDRHKPDAHYHAPLIEVHGEPSNVLESHPGFDADGKHRFSFWLTAGDNRLDLVAHSEIHYNAWVQGAEKFLLFGPVGLNPSLAFLTSPQKGVTQGWTGHSLVGKLMNSGDVNTSIVKK